MLNFLSKHKISLLITICVHFSLILYFNLNKIDLPPRINKHKILMELDFSLVEETNEEKTETLEDNKLTDQKIDEKIKNLMRDAQDRRAKSNSNYSEKNVNQEIEDKIKNIEKNVIKERNDAGKGFDPSKYDINKSTPQKINANTSTEKENQIAGSVITECNIPGRNCKTKTPAYTCPRGGKIYIDVKVNQKGKVTNAQVNSSKSTSKDLCIINQAIKYAKRCKANQDFNAPKSMNGYIIYNFISQ